jgi:hypothetical protein
MMSSSANLLDKYMNVTTGAFEVSSVNPMIFEVKFVPKASRSGPTMDCLFSLVLRPLSVYVARFVSIRRRYIL